MMRENASIAGVLALVTALTAFGTWPQAGRMASHLVEHQDAYFSIWRTSWIAHALATAPGRLFDTNIFHPAKGTLAYSDAMLLQGLLAAPFHWAAVSPVLIYNALLLAGFVGSGLAMFVLARHLTGRVGPALVSAAAFTMAPYRFEHIMHLELQWAMGVPLTWWAVHRTVAEQSWRFGALAGVFFALQALSCVYYSVFLGATLLVVVPGLLLLSGRRAPGAAGPLTVALIAATVLTLPYAWMYMEAGRTVGVRNLGELAEYSARPISYAATSASSWLWGWTADRWGGPELRLFPGLTVVALALVSVTSPLRRWVVLYGLVAVLAFQLSLGLNGAGYPWLLEHVPPLRGLRALARFGIITSAAMALLAGLGAHALIDRGRRLERRAALAATVILALMTVDLANRPLALRHGGIVQPSDVYKVIRSAGPGVVLELPMPRVHQLPGWEAFYSVWSTSHWHPLVNGYSGYYPPDYLQTLIRMESFPNEAAMNRLRAHDVRYVVVHRGFMEPGAFTNLMLRMATEKRFRPWGTYKDPVGDAVLFVLEP